LRYGLSYRDVEELLGERGIKVDHVTVYRWVQTFTSEFIDAARPSRRTGGDRWFVEPVPSSPRHITEQYATASTPSSP
jgi:transposase, IS6 family